MALSVRKYLLHIIIYTSLEKENSLLKILNKKNNISIKHLYLPTYLCFTKQKVIMKKVLFMAVAAAAFTFTSCNPNKTNANQEGVDSTMTEVVDDAQALTNGLNEALEANDASAVEKALTAVKEKLGSLDLEKGKEVLAKVQAFLKENADKIKSVVGGNAIAAGLIDNLTNLKADGLEALKAATENVGNAAEGAVEGVKDAAADKANAVKDAAAEKVNDAANKAAEKVNDAANKAADKAAEGAKKALGL